jgi:ATP-dependent DNA helicase RecG
MALPINISELLNGHTVEWDRIECKAGWNPEDIVHTIVAFANDLNNWGGGYIFVGVAEKDGIPQLPPVGLAQAKIDGIQKELLNLTYQIQPYYAPVSQPYVIEGKHILVIWVPGGDNRPYKAPTTLGEKGQKRYYIRRTSNSVLANQQEEQLLLDMAKRIPFDDRVNHHASPEDLDFGLIRDFLEDIKSDLRKEAAHMELAELATQMRIVAGPPEALLPINAGLLFFSQNPHKFFRGAITELITYSDDSGKYFTEKKFSGPIQKQLKQVLSFIESNIVRQRITKQSNKPEADRINNYPMAALEEVIANAFYHRSYELDNPIEINIFPDRIEVLTFPGPLPPVSKEMLKQRRIIARNYRNRRVGDFLKELNLTEGRSTGLPTIYDSMHENGSPKPVFETDDDFGYFLAVLPVHPLFLKEPEVLKKEAFKILQFCVTAKKRSEILEEIGLSNHPANYDTHIVPLLDAGLLAYTVPDKPRSSIQKYITTAYGAQVLG